MLPRILLIIFFVYRLGIALGEAKNTDAAYIKVGSLICEIIFINCLLWWSGWYDGFFSGSVLK